MKKLISIIISILFIPSVLAIGSYFSFPDYSGDCAPDDIECIMIESCADFCTEEGMIYPSDCSEEDCTPCTIGMSRPVCTDIPGCILERSVDYTGYIREDELVNECIDAGFIRQGQCPNIEGLTCEELGYEYPEESSIHLERWLWIILAISVGIYWYYKKKKKR